ncbi:MAG: sulfurtransferase TusA family protein [Promethearchaeota archaeon]
MGNIFELRCDGLVCPLPVAKTKRKLLEMKSGDILKVTGDYSEAGENIKNYIEKHGDKVLEFIIDGEDYLIKIQKS